MRDDKVCPCPQLFKQNQFLCRFSRMSPTVAPKVTERLQMMKSAVRWRSVVGDPGNYWSAAACLKWTRLCRGEWRSDGSTGRNRIARSAAVIACLNSLLPSQPAGRPVGGPAGRPVGWPDGRPAPGGWSSRHGPPSGGWSIDVYVKQIVFVFFCRNLVSASQDGKLIVWDGYTTNKVRFLCFYLIYK